MTGATFLEAGPAWEAEEARWARWARKEEAQWKGAGLGIGMPGGKSAVIIIKASQLLSIC